MHGRRGIARAVAGGVLVVGMVTGCGAKGPGGTSAGAGQAASIPADPKRPTGPPGSLPDLMARVNQDFAFWQARGVSVNAVFLDQSGTLVVWTDHPEADKPVILAHYQDQRITVAFGVSQTPA